MAHAKEAGGLQTRKCGWCPNSFKPRRSGGSDQIFCGDQCRHRFRSALKSYALLQLQAGRIGIEELKAASNFAHEEKKKGRWFKL